MEKYYVIYVNGDGDIFMSEHTREELLQALRNKDWGNADIVTKYPLELAELDKNMVIIKGEIVLPKPIEIIKDYDID